LDLEIAARLLNFIVLVLSLTVHEFFHAWTAWKLGDDTAARMGRMTLNPIPHIDIFGTILLPLMRAPIGWAKPVPVNPANFRRGVGMSTGDILVSVAGPLSNLLLALLASVVYGLALRLAPELMQRGGAGEELLVRLILVNVGLAIFNLIPLPPLDGSHVLGNLLPYRLRPAWAQMERFGPLVLFALLILERTANFPLISAVIGPPRSLVIAGLQLVIGGLAT
jgi:Zn-dependent protease